MKKKIFIFLLLLIIILSVNNVYCETLNDDKLYSKSAIAVDASSGSVLFEKNMSKKVYPASTTKILTAILAIENLDLDSNITVSQKAVNSTPYGSSTIYLKAGEMIKTEHLLYGLLVKSGNDAANVIAEEVSGDIDSFIKLMNDKATTIGCKNTHFTNAHGFHEDEHYTTAEDMAKIMEYCLKNDTFKKIIETKKITIPATNKSDARVLVNTNKMFDKSYKDMYYEYIIGGKTGFTDEANGTFVGYLKKDDKAIIVAVFDGPQDINGNESRFLDTIRISNFIFDDFTDEKVISKNDISFYVIDKISKKKYTLSLKDDIYSLTDNLVFRTSYDNLEIKRVLDTLSLGDVAGNITLSSKNSNKDFYMNKNFDLVITNISDYKEYDYKKIFRIIIIIFLSITLIILLNKQKKIKTKSKKLSRRQIKKDCF